MLSELQFTDRSSQSAVRLRGVKKRFGDFVALHGVSLDVMPGEIVSLLGPSGCGKTTTLRIIAGFERQDEGSVFLMDEEVSGRKVYERNIGFVFQDYALFPHMTVRENIAYGLRQKGWRRDDMSRRVSEMLDLVRLVDKSGHKPSQLSGGQQQRTALARALAPEPVVMLLDEPLSALDAKLREELRNELKTILKSAGSTTIIVTHDQREAMGLSDRIAIISRGRVIQQGTPDNIYNAPNSRYVAGFMGRSNIFIPTSKPRLNGTAWQIDIGDEFALLVEAEEAAIATCAEICVRAERIVLAPLDAGEHAAEQRLANRMVGTVKDVTSLGGETEIRVQLACGLEILAIEHNRRGPSWRPGEEILAMFSAADCVLLQSDLDLGARFGAMHEHQK